MKATKVRVKELDLGVVREGLAFAGKVLPAEHYEPLRDLVEAYVSVLELLKAKNASIRKMREMLFGAPTERLCNLTGKPPGQAARRAKEKPRNHGRNGADAYPGAQQFVLRHPLLKHGDECPDCKCGKLYEPKRELVVVRFFGQQPIAAKVWKRKCLRCLVCGGLFYPDLPAEAHGKKYDETAVSTIALEKYALGTGFNRLEGFQESLGVPLPAATQWDLLDENAKVLVPVYEEHVRQAANDGLIHNDDTPNRILELDEKKTTPEAQKASGGIAQHGPQTSAPLVLASESGQTVPTVKSEPEAKPKATVESAPPAPSAPLAPGLECVPGPITAADRPPPNGIPAPAASSDPARPAGKEKPVKAPKDKKAKRTGQYTTAIVAVGVGHRIALFFTGRKHAGENLDEVLKRRAAGLPPPKQMCDGLDRNLPANFKTLPANCLAHGRRKFFDLFAYWPDECRHVLEELAKVYGTDARAKELGLSDEERMGLHQAESAEVMADLKVWMEAQFQEKKVEPNSRLGKVINYCLKRWERLTRFLTVPGAPLDNNLAERVLKMVIRHRTNSLFFKTLRGAAVADLFMTLIHTCLLNGANPFDYLVALLRHTDLLAASPADWMPWNYKETLARPALEQSLTVEKPDGGTG